MLHALILTCILSVPDSWVLLLRRACACSAEPFQKMQPELDESESTEWRNNIHLKATCLETGAIPDEHYSASSLRELNGEITHI
ncbi:hypothetical protein SprV_0802611000 [Sparganum proliferum]